ncbi:hypothetical protein ACLOJK_014430 [Asimina triloba]
MGEAMESGFGLEPVKRGTVDDNENGRKEWRGLGIGDIGRGAVVASEPTHWWSLLCLWKCGEHERKITKAGPINERKITKLGPIISMPICHVTILFLTAGVFHSFIVTGSCFANRDNWTHGTKVIDNLL